MAIWQALISPVTAVAEMVNSHFKDKRKLKQTALDSKVHIAQARADSIVKRLETGQEADIAWENLSIGHSGWKDEWFTILLSIPMILCFIPGMDIYVVKGFQAINDNVPDWYQWSFMVAVASAFGYKKLADVMSLKKGSK